MAFVASNSFATAFVWSPCKQTLLCFVDISWDTVVWIVGPQTVVTDACVVEVAVAIRAASMDVLTTLW